MDQTPNNSSPSTTSSSSSSSSSNSSLTQKMSKLLISGPRKIISEIKINVNTLLQEKLMESILQAAHDIEEPHYPTYSPPSLKKKEDGLGALLREFGDLEQPIRGYTILQHAFHNMRLRAALRLLKVGCGVEGKEMLSKDGVLLPWVWVSTADVQNLIKQVLIKGCRTNVCDAQGNNLVSQVILGVSLDAAQAYRSQNRSYYSYSYYYNETSSSNLATLFIENRVDYSKPDAQGTSTLMLALMAHEAELVETLLKLAPASYFKCPGSLHVALDPLTYVSTLVSRNKKLTTRLTGTPESKASYLIGKLLDSHHYDMSPTALEKIAFQIIGMNIWKHSFDTRKKLSTPGFDCLPVLGPFLAKHGDKFLTADIWESLLLESALRNLYSVCKYFLLVNHPLYPLHTAGRSLLLGQRPKLESHLAEMAPRIQTLLFDQGLIHSQEACVLVPHRGPYRYTCKTCNRILPASAFRSKRHRTKCEHCAVKLELALINPAKLEKNPALVKARNELTEQTKSNCPSLQTLCVQKIAKSVCFGRFDQLELPEKVLAILKDPVRFKSSI